MDNQLIGTISYRIKKKQASGIYKPGISLGGEEHVKDIGFTPVEDVRMTSHVMECIAVAMVLIEHEIDPFDEEVDKQALGIQFWLDRTEEGTTPISIYNV